MSSAEEKEKERLALEKSAQEEMDQLKRTPRLELADARFVLNCVHSTEAEKKEAQEFLMAGVKEQSMTPFYKFLCEEQKWSMDSSLHDSLEATNIEEIKKLDAAIKDAEENFGETEVREANLAKADYLCAIGDKEAAVEQFEVTMKKTVSLGQKLDVVFTLIRLGFFYSDVELRKKYFEKAEEMMEKGGDWDRRNRLKVYKAVHATSQRKFKEASELFLSTVSTFTCYEVLSYVRFVDLCVVMSIASLNRSDLKEKVMKGPEIQEMLHQSPIVKSFLESIMNCDYAAFFRALEQISDIMKKDVLLAPHRVYYVREMRVLAYSQLLESYRSVTLTSMAKSFGVSVDFIDSEVAKFVAAGRLNCKIDKVGGIIETTRPDSKNAQYQKAIKDGDILLNRIQKLSQVANI